MALIVKSSIDILPWTEMEKQKLIEEKEEFLSKKNNKIEDEIEEKTENNETENNETENNEKKEEEQFKNSGKNEKLKEKEMKALKEDKKKEVNK